MECTDDNMSTNYAFAKYQEIYDINTVSNSVSVIGIHTPVGAKPRQMLSGFFTQFRKYKYRGCSVVATPAQRLGLNLAQISTAAGQSTVNPKDVWNPALVRGCHGDNLNAALNSIYKGSFQSEGSTIGKDDFAQSVVPTGSLSWEQMYYRMLQDPSFKKFNLASGIKISKLHPLVYNVASDKQILPNESYLTTGQGAQDTASPYIVGMNARTRGDVANGSGTSDVIFPNFMTNRLQSLGWMDTRQVLNGSYPDTKATSPGYTTIPKIFMACIVLPPALSDSVVTSLRFVVTHYFEFKEFNTSLTLEGASEYYNWLTVVSSKELAADPSKVDNDTFDTIGTKDSIDIVSDGIL